MCEHCHEANSYVIARTVFSVILFVAGFKFPVLFVAAYLLIGIDILLKAVKNIIQGKLFDENFLMAIATVGALTIGEYPEAVMVMLLYQLGEYLQDKAVDKSKDSIVKLMDIRPDYANMQVDGKIRKVSPDKIKPGDIIIVNPGEKIPLDGKILDGETQIDTSALTGESVPRFYKAGEKIQSGCINLTGTIKVYVEKEFKESTVSKILKLTEHAADKKAKTENFITRFAKIYTPAVVLLAMIIAFILPVFFEGNWFERALTFLVISCPCALVISVPLSFFAGIGSASQNGILIKGSSYLEQLSKIKNAVFDKTGTLTKGKFKVTEIISENPEILKIAAYAESASSHPAALAIKSAYGKEIPTGIKTEEIAGKGIKAIVNGQEVLCGTAEFTHSKPVKQNGTVIYISVNNKPEGCIVISDEIKEDTQKTILCLNKLHIKTIMLSGDNTETADNIGKQTGINEVYAELLPQDKVKKLEEIMDFGTTSYTGDGINDAPVLARADIGIAMGGLGSDAAIEAADIVIMDDKPSKILTAIKISKKTMRIVRENIIFALTVKVLFLILGSFGLITMWGAVFADVGTSLIAILNSLRILK